MKLVAPSLFACYLNWKHNLKKKNCRFLERKVLPPLHSRALRSLGPGNTYSFDFETTITLTIWSPIDLNSFPMARPLLGLADRHWKWSKSPFLARVIRVQSCHRKRVNAFISLCQYRASVYCIGLLLEPKIFKWDLNKLKFCILSKFIE